MNVVLMSNLICFAPFTAIAQTVEESAPPSPLPSATAGQQPTPSQGTALPEVEVVQKPEENPEQKNKQSSQPTPQTPPAELKLPDASTVSYGPPPLDVPVKMSPLSGSEIPLDKVPGAVGRINANEIATDGTRQVQNVLNQQVPGIILSDTAGGGLRTDIQYRGFDASPVGGRS
ncbi:MAG: TonB-dependent receptor plug domain-containing protein, partial [Hyphomicrobium sp.]